MFLPEVQAVKMLFGWNSPRFICFSSILAPVILGGPGGGVTTLMLMRTMPTTLRITNREMKIPFQSRDLDGIETSSCKSNISQTLVILIAWFLVSRWSNNLNISMFPINLLSLMKIFIVATNIFSIQNKYWCRQGLLNKLELSCSDHILVLWLRM